MDKILLFIPMYNCGKQICRVLSQLKSEAAEYISQVIVVNNRSTDGGEASVIAWLENNPLSVPCVLLRNNDNYGLGGSHKIAFDYAMENSFDYIIVLHGDDQGDISNLLPYLKSHEYAKWDSFLGARFMKGSALKGYSHFRTFGNRVYNIFFSVGAGRRVYDLGSGLNMYKVESLKSHYYLRFKDNLMFNCYMLLAAKPLGQRLCFFPISWREEDQVSNVKMMNQAVRTMLMLFKFVLSPSALLKDEYRDKLVESYGAEKIYSTTEA